jgi:nucleotide-binding universal stress UspA family protein
MCSSNREEKGEEKMFNKILVPTDGSQGVEKAIKYAAAIAGRFGAEVHILFVAEPFHQMIFYELGDAFPAQVQDIIENMHQLGEKIVEKTAKELVAHGVKDVNGEVRDGHPAEVILDYVQEKGIDLIAMGTHGRRGLNRVLLGSVADEVVHRATVPVMTVRMTEK